MQLLEALWWTTTSTIGFFVTIPVMIRAYQGWARLEHERVDAGMTVMIWSHVQTDALRILMHLLFLILGLTRLLGPPFVIIVVANPFGYWIGVIAIMLIPVALIAMTLLEEHARWKSVHQRVR